MFQVIVGLLLFFAIVAFMAYLIRNGQQRNVDACYDVPPDAYDGLSDRSQAMDAEKKQQARHMFALFDALLNHVKEVASEESLLSEMISIMRDLPWVRINSRLHTRFEVFLSGWKFDSTQPTESISCLADGLRVNAAELRKQIVGLPPDWVFTSLKRVERLGFDIAHDI